MAWDQIEATPPHLSYLVLSTFLIIYALFSVFIQNRLHIAEPPLATLVGIVLGPRATNIFTPYQWGLGDNVMQEVTRIIVGVECFTIGVELPKRYLSKHWSSIALMLGPVMTSGWLVCGLCVWWLFGVPYQVALIISACLTPTDPVLASTILANTSFSERIPRHLKLLLSAESASNDGTSFPFLYVGLSILAANSFGSTVKQWFLVTILWQCVFGIFLGLIIGQVLNYLLRFSDKNNLVGRATYVVFYLLAALFCVGVASILGLDDFLVAFSAGASFAHDGSFAEKTAESHLGEVVDLLLNSSFFVYFGASIPWSSFTSSDSESALAELTLGKLFALLALILAFRRIPFVLACKPFIKDLKTWKEALFAGHFGPMGVGALFLAIEARAQMETDTAHPMPHPPPPGTLPNVRQRGIELVWPIICFIVLGSIYVHGFSTLAISIGGHLSRHEGERAPLIGGESDGFAGMVHGEESD